ncbi:hypothetical protein I6B53_05315 [Schaalia sp. 19OD2882]|uniref:hypothetical protein n=1 Tax=Schaalia sp. 19OD2882 TaxID=2794089 RepID=UPI001C1EF14A|nr:hypothetical protein [Schaalia sp. 19OD2882]QWW20484.1 hypothetical protein I6B53_05315 [Schaalia sp. 19OD2882]
MQWWAPVLVITSLAAHLSEEILRASVANRLVRILLGTAVGVPLGCVAAALTGVPVAWLAIDLLALGGAIILALSRGKGVSDEDTGAVISRPGRGRPVRKAVPLAVSLTVSVGALTGLVAASWDTIFGFLPGIAQLGESLAPGSGVPVTVFGLDGQQMAFLAPLVLLPMWGICESAIARHSHLSIWGPIGFLWTGWALASLTIVSDTVGQTVRRVAEATHLFTDPKGFDVLVTMLVVLTLPGVVWLVDRHLPRRWPVRLPVAVFVACAWTLSGLIVLFGTPWFFAPLAAVVLIVRVWTVRPALGAPGQNRGEQTDGPGH